MVFKQWIELYMHRKQRGANLLREGAKIFIRGAKNYDRGAKKISKLRICIKIGHATHLTRIGLIH